MGAQLLARNRAGDDGIAPTFAFIARRKAKEAILRMIQMREELSTKKKIKVWVEGLRRA